MGTDTLFNIPALPMVMNTIYNAGNYEPQRLLIIIEQTKDAFTEGRRNNDMINWYVAKRLIDLEAGERMGRLNKDILGAYLVDFERYHDRMTQRQKDALRYWSEDPEWKLENICKHYNKTNDPGYLWYLWLPMDYSMYVA